MTSSPFSSIEALESRIAPAGLITIEQSGGALLFTGGADAAKFRVEQVSASFWLVTGVGDTLLKLGETGAEQASAVVKAPSGSVTVNFGAGNDAVTFVGVKLPQALTVNGGDGANSTELQSVTAIGKVTVNGGTGGDEVTVSGFKSKLAGGFAANLGDGGNSLKVDAGATSFTSLSYLGGAGNDAVDFSGGNVAVKGNLVLDGGAAGVSNFNLKPSNLTVTGGIQIQDGAGNGKLHVTPGGSLRVGQTVEINGGLGDDDIRVGGGGAMTSLGSVKINGGEGSSDSVSIKAGATLQVIGSISISGGAHSAAVSGDAVKIGGSVTAEMGDNPNAQRAKVEITANSSLRISGGVEVLGGSGKFTYKLASAGLLSVAGTTKFANTTETGAEAGLSIEAANAKLLGGLDLSISSGSFDADLSGGAFLIGGNLKLTDSGSGASALVVDVHSLAVRGDLLASAAADSLTVRVKTQGVFAVSQNVLVDVGGGRATVDLNAAAAKIAGRVGVEHSGTHANVSITGRHLAGFKIGQDLRLQLAAATAATVQLEGVSVKAAANIVTSSGADTLRIDDSIFGASVAVDLGAGADTALVETRSTLLPATTTFKQTVNFLMGDGDDVLTIGDAAEAVARAVFNGSASFDGGDGANDRLNNDSRNGFKLASQPTVTGFEL